MLGRPLHGELHRFAIGIGRFGRKVEFVEYPTMLEMHLGLLTPEVVHAGIIGGQLVPDRGRPEKGLFRLLQAPANGHSVGQRVEVDGQIHLHGRVLWILAHNRFLKFERLSEGLFCLHVPLLAEGMMPSS